MGQRGYLHARIGAWGHSAQCMRDGPGSEDRQTHHGLDGGHIRHVEVEVDVIVTNPVRIGHRRAGTAP